MDTAAAILFFQTFNKTSIMANGKIICRSPSVFTICYLDLKNVPKKLRPREAPTFPPGFFRTCRLAALPGCCLPRGRRCFRQSWLPVPVRRSLPFCGGRNPILTAYSLPAAGANQSLTFGDSKIFFPPDFAFRLSFQRNDLFTPCRPVSPLYRKQWTWATKSIIISR